MANPPGYRERVEIMDEARLQRTLARMAHEILERHPDVGTGGVLVGVRTRGVPLAKRLAAIIREAGGDEPVVGALDITLYRDDLTTIAPHPVLKGTHIPVSIDGKPVVLVDDVLFTGRTVRAALDELVDFGRPSRIELAVVVDRGHRELPIEADYVGKAITPGHDEVVQVMLKDIDGEDRVVLLEKGGGGPASSPAAAKPAGKGKARTKTSNQKASRRAK